MVADMNHLSQLQIDYVLNIEQKIREFIPSIELVLVSTKNYKIRKIIFEEKNVIITILVHKVDTINSDIFKFWDFSGTILLKTNENEKGIGVSSKKYSSIDEVIAYINGYYISKL